MSKKRTNSDIRLVRLIGRWLPVYAPNDYDEAKDGPPCLWRENGQYVMKDHSRAPKRVVEPPYERYMDLKRMALWMGVEFVRWEKADPRFLPPR